MSEQDIYNDLTELHIGALYDFMVPVNHLDPYSLKYFEDRKKEAVTRYRDDPISHHRVMTLVQLTMSIVKGRKWGLK